MASIENTSSAMDTDSNTTETPKFQGVFESFSWENTQYQTNLTNNDPPPQESCQLGTATQLSSTSQKCPKN